MQYSCTYETMPPLHRRQPDPKRVSDVVQTARARTADVQSRLPMSASHRLGTPHRVKSRLHTGTASTAVGVQSDCRRIEYRLDALKLRPLPKISCIETVLHMCKHQRLEVANDVFYQVPMW